MHDFQWAIKQLFSLLAGVFLLCHATAQSAFESIQSNAQANDSAMAWVQAASKLKNIEFTKKFNLYLKAHTLSNLFELERETYSMLHSNIAFFFQKTGHFEASHEQFQLTFKYVDPDDNVYQSWLYNGIATNYYLTENFDSAIHYLKISYGLLPEEIGRRHISNRNTLGLIMMENDAQGALHIFQKAFQTCPDCLAKTRNIGYALLDNIATCHFTLGNPDSALIVYQSILQNLAPDKFPNNAERIQIKRYWRTYMGMVECYELKEDWFKAKQMLDSAAQFFTQPHLEPESKIQYFQLLEKWAESQNNWRLALSYQIQLSEFQDSIYDARYDVLSKVNESYAVIRTENFEKDLQTERRNLLQTQLSNRKSRVIFVVSAFLLVAVASIIVILLRRRLAIKQLEKEISEQQLVIEQQKREQTEKDLETKSKDVQDLITFTNEIQMFKTFTDDLEEKVRDMDQLSQKSDLLKQIQEIQRQLDTQNKLAIILEKQEEVNHVFFEKLKDQFPTLTENERQLCAYFRLGLSTKEVAQIRKVKTETIRMARYRIRRKLALTPEVRLPEFMQDL